MKLGEIYGFIFGDTTTALLSRDPKAPTDERALAVVEGRKEKIKEAFSPEKK